MSPIGVAILGSGIFAREEHMPAVLAAPSLLTLKAVYSRSLKSAQSLVSSNADKDVSIYSDDSTQGQKLDDLLARTDVHAVIIALPILVQPDIIRKALQAGKHVLSEKPIAQDIQTARNLLKWYRDQTSSGTTKATWAVAENVRFYATFAEAAKIRETQGRTLTFRVRVQSLVKAGWKYAETEWRKTPGYQGGFLLDGGVHYAAGIRRLLGKDNSITQVSAYTAQLQPHLPPVDTVEATALTKLGALGTISISMGTTSKGSEFNVASENGVVGVGFDQIIIDGQTREVKNEGSGVAPEVRAWAEGLVNKGRPDPQQSPEEALADLSLIEALLQSGEKGGVPVQVENQQL